MTEVLAAGGIVLRPLRASDAAPIALHCADLRVARMTTRIPHPYPPGAAETFVADAAGAPVWAMDGAAAGLPEVCGIVSLTVRGAAAPELGYWVAPPLWRRGLASSAVAALLRANPGGAAVVISSVFKDNPASGGVLAGAGFLRTGEDTAHSLARGGPVPRWLYERAMW